MLMRSVVLKPMRKNKLIILVLVLQVALSLSIVSNSIQIISDMYRSVTIRSGVADDEIVIAKIEAVGSGNVSVDDYASWKTLWKMKGGADSVSFTNAVPISSSEWTAGIKVDPAQPSEVTAAQYVVSEDFVVSSGAALLRGRDFLASEFVDFDTVLPRSPSALITDELEQRLFPSEGGIGRPVYIGNSRYTIVGIVDRLARPSIQDPGDAGLSIILPAKPNGAHTIFALIKISGEPAAASRRLEEVTSSQQHHISFTPYQDLRVGGLESQRYLLRMMVAVLVVSIIIGWLGIYVLTSLWVRQRYPSYAIRRVLGATRVDITQLIVVETQMVTLLGCVLGLLLSVLLNRLCVLAYGTNSLSVLVLLLAVLAVLSSGLIASVRPALRASSFDLVAIMQRNI